jgi:hypothetical protein
MSWLIKCVDSTCASETWTPNIVDLLDRHRDSAGWFLCSCGKQGYVEKSFSLQEPGEVWEPFLRGAIRLGQTGDTYQPFVFLVASKPDGPVDAIWFSYYKDLRPNGRLKLGYGPGGPPVLKTHDVGTLVQTLSRLASSFPGSIVGY